MKTKYILIVFLISYILVYFLLETELSFILPDSIQFIGNIKHVSIFIPIILSSSLLKNKTKVFLFSIILILFSFYKPHLYNFYKCVTYKQNQDGKIIKIGTFNLAGSSLSITEVDTLILNEKIDILALQEVSQSFIHSESYEYLIKYLNYGIYNNNKEGFWTQLSLSKFELINNKFLDPGEGFTSRDTRIIIESQFTINNKKITLLNNHLSIPFKRSSTCKGLKCLISNYNQYDRDKQLNFLKNYIEIINGNVILIGDFNLSDQNYSYIKFSENLIDTGLCSAKLNYTWSNELFFPIIRLDYIFLKYDRNQIIIPISTKTIKFENSDHLGIITELKIL